MAIVPFFAFSQDGSLIANTKTSNIDFKIKTSILGLWEVKLVTVEEKTMTPVAKWFQINENGALTGGNGWSQNIDSKWEYDDVNKTLLFVTNTIPDEYGAFSLTLNENKMLWSRNEEGQTVNVHLELTDKKPLAPWDKIVAIWKWVGMAKQHVATNEIQITEVESDWTQIRWDKRYDTFDASGNRTESGIWHFDAHQPLLTIYDDKDEKFVWHVDFLDDQMIWTREVEKSTLKLTFEKSVKIGN